MALIGTIRKNNWLLLVVIGLALVAFLFMDSMGNQNLGSGVTGPTIGEVAGTEIGYNEFQRAQSTLYNNSSADPFVVKNTLWNFFVEKALVNKEANALGIDVSKEELRDLQFGANLSPIIQQSFRNQQTGQVDRASLENIKNQIDNGDFRKPEFANARAYWGEQEKQIVKDQKQAKLSSLVSKAMFTPTWMIEMQNAENQANYSFDYVKIPFDYIPNTDVEISDADLKSYIQSNPAKYTNDKETRRAEFIVFDVIATPADSMARKEEMNLKISELKRTKEIAVDSAFAINNNGSYVNYYAKADEMPENLKSVVPTMEVGTVYGPYIDNGFYSAIKLLDKKVVPDSVEARHILRRVAPGDFVGMETAKAKIDSIKNEITSRRAKFADMATQFSEDAGSAAKGGDLGSFVQGAMVPEFNKAAMFGAEKELQVVTTSIGVHLIEVLNKKYTNQEPKYKTAIIRIPITPSKDTQDNLYADVSELISKNKDITSLKAAADAKGISTETSAFVDQNAYALGSLGSGNTSREIVKWMFNGNTEIGNVSPEVYTYSDPNFYYNNKYVAVSLNATNPKGLSTVDGVRSQIENLVKNKKKGEQIISKISGNDINAIASQFGQTVANVPSANLSSTSIPGMGNEPKVLSTVAATAANSVSNPVIGNSGVYIVKTTNKYDAPPATNIPSLRATANNADRSRARTALMNALKKEADIKDRRLSADM